MTADKPPELQIPIRRMLELECAEEIVNALADGKLPALTDDELKKIIAIAGGDAPLFDPDSLEPDGWRRDHNRSWVPPNIHAIDDAPVRGQGERLRPQPAHGSGSGTSGSSTAAQQKLAELTQGSSTAAQKLAALTPTQFRDECEAIRNDELRKRWANDRENWIHRWDRRADLIGRWGRRQLP